MEELRKNLDEWREAFESKESKAKFERVSWERQS